jgi:hypothetical protein
MKNIFRPMQMYTDLTQDTSTISINQLLTSHTFRKAYIMLVWDVKSGGTERQAHKTVTNVYCCYNIQMNREAERA